MRSLSANQRELNQADYNAYKYSSKVNFDNFGISKSPKFENKYKDKEKKKIKIEIKKYTEIVKSKENYCKSNYNNNNLNMNLNNVNNFDNNNNFGNFTTRNFNNNLNLNNEILYVNYQNMNLTNRDYYPGSVQAQKSPEKVIHVFKYSDKLKTASAIKNLAISNASSNKYNNNYSNLNNSNSNQCINNYQNLNNSSSNLNKLNSQKILESTSHGSNLNNNLNTNQLVNNSTNYSNSNLATKHLAINSSSNCLLNNQNSMLNNTSNYKKYNQDEIHYKIRKLFEYYCQFGERLNTSCLKSNKFIKFSLEADIIDENINKTRLELIFSSENKTKSKAQIDFDCFLNCLIKVAEIKYGNEYKGANKSLQALIDNKILPLYEKIFNSISPNENECDFSMHKRNIVSNFSSDIFYNNNNPNLTNINNLNNNSVKQNNRKGSDYIFDSKTSLELSDHNIITSSFNMCYSVKNMNNKSKNIFNKIDDIQEVINSHNNSVLGTEGNIVNNNNEENKNEVLIENEQDHENINNINNYNFNNSTKLHWNINNINPNNLATNNFLDNNNNNNYIVCANNNLSNLHNNFNNNQITENITSTIFQNPAKKNLPFEESFQKSPLEEILINASVMLFEIYKVYFPWELSLTNDENFMRENSHKNYFLLLKEFDICPDIISKSSAYQIWKEQVENKLEKNYFDNSVKNSNNKANYSNYTDRINENILYYNVLKNIDTNGFSSSIQKKNSTNKEKKNIGKYFSFVKFLKCLCLIADNGIDKYCNFENEIENIENLNAGQYNIGLSNQQTIYKPSSLSNILGNLNTSSTNNFCNLNNNANIYNNNNLVNNNEAAYFSNIKGMARSSSKNGNRSMSLNSNINYNHKPGNYKYEYNFSEKVFLLLEKMELSRGFLNIQQKTSKTNSYKSSFIVSRDLTERIRTEIENKINDIKKENNNDLEKREDYEIIQRQKKLKLSIKNNFKNIFEHRNYIVDRYGAKLSDLFKNYCCFGDPLNTTWMKSNKFSKLLKDANLLILHSRDSHHNPNSESVTSTNFTGLNNNLISNINKNNKINNSPYSANNKNVSGNNENNQLKDKEPRGILVNDIDVIFIKLSTANSLNVGNNNMNTSVYGSNLRDLSMNTYISLGTIANKNSLNMTRSSFSSSLSPNKIQNFKKNVNSITNSAKIDFNGFVNAIEIISLNIFPERNEFEAIDIIVTKHLLPLLQNFNHKNKYSDKYSILFQEKNNNFEYVLYFISLN